MQRTILTTLVCLALCSTAAASKFGKQKATSKYPFQKASYGYKVHVNTIGQQKVFKGFDLVPRQPNSHKLKVIGTRRAIGGARSFTADYVATLKAHGAYNIKEVHSVGDRPVFSFSVRRDSAISKIQKTASRLARMFPDQQLNAMQERPLQLKVQQDQKTQSVPSDKPVAKPKTAKNNRALNGPTFETTGATHYGSPNAEEYSRLKQAGFSGTGRPAGTMRTGSAAHYGPIP